MGIDIKTGTTQFAANSNMSINMPYYSASFISTSYAVSYVSSSTTVGAERTIDSYAEANADQFNYISSAENLAIGQSFRSSGDKLTRVTFYGKAVGTLSGNTFAQLYAHSGTFGTTGFPSGSVLATSDAINSATLSSVSSPVTFTFTGDQQYVMTSGSAYVIAWSYTGGSAAADIGVEVDISAPTAAGRGYYLKGTTWFTTTQDGGKGTSGATDDMVFILSGSAITTTTINSSSIDLYAISNRDANVTLGTGGSNFAYAQSFTGNGKKLINGVVSLLKTGSPTGYLVLRIYDHIGTFGTNGLPTGGILATSDVLDVSTLTVSNVSRVIKFTGDNAVTLSSGTNYFLSVEYAGGSSGNTVSVGVDSSSPTASGNAALLAVGATTWTTSASDMCFELYGV